MNLNDLKKPLTADEIEFRIGRTKQGSGFSVLLYKTARTDRNRLDKVCGPLNWQNTHYNDSHGNVVCGISIYDKEKGEWITKYDVGIESYTEKEKGSYSDSFKRAGFRWGIGVELYKAPFIWIPWKKWNGKKPIGAYLQNWSIELYGDGILDGFLIKNDKGIEQYKTDVTQTYKDMVKQEWGTLLDNHRKKLIQDYEIEKPSDLKTEAKFKEFYMSIIRLKDKYYD